MSEILNININNKPIEIIDNVLWKPGYSIYLTDWCCSYLAINLYSRHGIESNLNKLHQEVLLVWYAHHLKLEINNLLAPEPPRLFHIQTAYRIVTGNNLLVQSGNDAVIKMLPVSVSKPRLIDWRRSPLLKTLKVFKSVLFNG